MKKTTKTLSALTVALLAACGGGGGGGTTTTTTTPAVQTQTASQTQQTQQTEQTKTDSLVTQVPATTTYVDEKAQVFEQLNADRGRCGFGLRAQSAKIDKAAQAHADYLAGIKNVSHSEDPADPGFTGSTPAARVAAAGYDAAAVGEAVGAIQYGTYFGTSSPTGAYPRNSATPLGARNGLRGLYSTVYHLQGLMAGYLDVGIGVSTYGDLFTNKILVINAGIPTGKAEQTISADAVVSFPCQGTTGLNPYFAEYEVPNPFPNVTMSVTPYGSPIYFMSGKGSTITIASARVSRVGGADVPVTTLTKANDPQGRLTANQVFVVPTQPLADNATYEVAVSGTSSGKVTAANPSGAFSAAFTFTTGTYTTD